MSAYLDNIEYDKFELISGAGASRPVIIPSPAVDVLSWADSATLGTVLNLKLNVHLN